MPGRNKRATMPRKRSKSRCCNSGRRSEVKSGPKTRLDCVSPARRGQSDMYDSIRRLSFTWKPVEPSCPGRGQNRGQSAHA